MAGRYCFMLIKDDMLREVIARTLRITEDPCLEVSTMFLLKRLYQNIQMCAYLSHFFYAKNYFNFFVFMI